MIILQILIIWYQIRLIRAIQLDFLKIHLPRDEWITYEADRDYRYLSPYIAEVKAEWREIYEFGCANYRQEQRD